MAFPPLFAAALYIDGSDVLFSALHELSWRGGLSVFYIAYVSTWLGYGLWTWLLSVYPVGMVVPFTLFVPVVALLTSSVALGEGLQSWKLLAASFILLGLMMHLFGAKISHLFKFRLM